MFSDGQLLEQIIIKVKQLSPADRLRLIQRVVETLISTAETPAPQPLMYGQFSGDKMSTDEDFLIAEWRPTDQELDGP